MLTMMFKYEKDLHVHEENVEVDKEEELQIIRQMIFSSFKKIR